MTWLQQGTVFKKYAHGVLTTATHHPCRVWIRSSHLCYGNMQARARGTTVTRSLQDRYTATSATATCRCAPVARPLHDRYT